MEHLKRSCVAQAATVLGYLPTALYKMTVYILYIKKKTVSLFFQESKTNRGMQATAHCMLLAKHSCGMLSVQGNGTRQNQLNLYLTN